MYTWDVVVQPDRKVLIAAEVSSIGAAVLRLTSDGRLDESFGSGGIASQPIGTAGPYGLTLEESGSILAAGIVALTPTSQASATITRFSPEGIPDSSFGEQGMATVESATAFNSVLTTGGSLLAFGRAATQTSDEMAFLRLGPGGQYDPAELQRMGSGFGGFVDTTFDADGRVLFAGGGGVGRLAGDAIDGTFGIDGRISLDDCSLSAVSPLSDGRLIALGRRTTQNGSRWLLAGFDATGAMDPMFGEYVFDLEEPWLELRDIEVDSKGRIVVVGTSRRDTGPIIVAAIFLQRFMPDGTPDEAFGSGVPYRIYEIPGMVGPTALALESNDGIVVAGWAQDADLSAFDVRAFVARFNP